MPDTETPGALVLVVEDNPANMMLVCDVLRRGGFRTAQAHSTNEAREQIAAAEPALILMDIQLPGEDGLSLTRALKAAPATSHIPIIALTAHAMKGDELQAREAGCDSYMAKPIDTRSFAAFVADFLSAPVRNS